jgi:uncharacterized protein
MYQRAFKAPEQSFFLFGPRGVGKSTWIKHLFPNALVINLLEPNELRYYASYPERLRDLIQAAPDKKDIVIDEIQKVPELLPLVHSLIEEDKTLRFVLTGSSSRKLKRTGANLLAARAQLCFMFPFLASELGQDFDIMHALEHGMIPLIYKSKDKLSTLQTYISLYLKEEVQEEGLVRHLGDFARFLEVISFSHASIINTSNISRECDVARKTCENYISILEDLLLAFTLPVFSKRAKRILSVHPKIYLFDCGVFKALRPKGPLDSFSELNGHALEGLVAQHLYAWVKSQIDSHTLSFYRTKSGLEVDFIVYGPKGFWAIEVKFSNKLHPQDLHGLQSFHQDYPECQPLLLYMGNKKIMMDNIMCLPVHDFLVNLKLNQKLLEN